ncbi:MAG: fatty acid desaturase [Verrucomicrobiales bacterium]|nr:fatty acid desaturase [Verrucomicrobiales bacterium]
MPIPVQSADSTPALGEAPTTSNAKGRSIQEWKAIVAEFSTPSLPKAIWQLVDTLVPYVLLWAAMIWSLKGPYWVTLGLAALAGLLLVRVFIIFHDCGHGSFFKSKRANNVVGFLTGMLTFTPYSHWTWQHAVHHQTSGDLDRRGEGDIWTLTVEEYLAAPKWKRFLYRVARNPIVLFLVAPLGMFWIYQRFSSPNAKAGQRHSVWLMNLALAAMVGGLVYALGWKQYLMIQTPLTLVAGASGIWMFYVQHQFEDVYWKRREEWDYTTAAVEGSSFYKLPRILQWFTGNIGFHHVHHLSSRIPNYHLEACHNSHPMFRDVKPITLMSSLKCANLRLFDEEAGQLVGYKRLREIRRQRKQSAA